MRNIGPGSAFSFNNRETDMSKTDHVTENPNEKMPAGKPLSPDEVAPTDNNGLGDDGLGPTNEDEDQPGLPDEGASDDDIPVGGPSVGP